MRERSSTGSSQEDSKFGRFMELYAFHFGALTERDGIKGWREFVEPLNEETLKKVLASLADFNERNPAIATRKPRSNRIRAIYDKMSPRDEPGQKYDNMHCGTCSSTGWVQKIHSYRQNRMIRSDEYEGGTYAYVLVPCACPHGRNHQNNDHSRRIGSEGAFAFDMSRQDIEVVLQRAAENNRRRAA